jgi:hypothetical protein
MSSASDWFAASNFTSLVSKLLQSIKRADFSWAMQEMNWSIIPHGMFAKVCSAFWQSRAFSIRLQISRSNHVKKNLKQIFSYDKDFPVNASKKVQVATSIDALLESPPPKGTLETTKASNPSKASENCSLNFLQKTKKWNKRTWKMLNHPFGIIYPLWLSWGQRFIFGRDLKLYPLGAIYLCWCRDPYFRSTIWFSKDHRVKWDCL